MINRDSFRSDAELENDVVNPDGRKKIGARPLTEQNLYRDIIQIVTLTFTYLAQYQDYVALRHHKSQRRAHSPAQTRNNYAVHNPRLSDGIQPCVNKPRPYDQFRPGFKISNNNIIHTHGYSDNRNVDIFATLGPKQ